MNLVTSGFDKNDKSIQALTARNQALNKEIGAQKDKVTTLEAALANATESFGENDKRTQAWAIQLNNAKAELNGMERELGNNNKALHEATSGMTDAEREALGLGKAVDETGRELGDTGKEAKNLGGEMDETGKKSSVFADVLKANLAADAIKAGLTAIVDMVKAIGAAVKDYVSDSMSMATAAAESQTLLTQVMRNTMSASDDEIRSLVELAAAQEKVGVVSKTAQVTALAELSSFVSRKESLEDMLPVMNDYIAYQYGATASSEQARNVATALGKAIDGNVDGLAKQGFKLSQTEKEWFKTATEAERAAFVIDMVSESMGGVNEALAQTDAGKMASLATVMTNTKIAVGSMANEFKAQILGQMLPSISSLSDAFLGLLRGEASVEDLAATFAGVFDQVISIIDTFLPKLIEIGSQIITAVVTGLSGNMDAIVGGALSLMNMLVNAILDLLPIILDAGMKLLFGLIDGIVRALPLIADAAIQIVVALAKGLGESLPELIPAVVQAIVTVVTTIIDNLPMILDAALQIILGLVDGLLAALPQLIAALPAIIIGIVNFVIGAIPQIIDAGIKLLISLVDALPEIIDAIVLAIPEIIDGIINAVVNAIPQLIEAGIKLLVSLVQNLPKIILTIVEAIPKIITSIINAVVGNIDKIIMAGVQLFVSLIQNLPAIIVEIVKAVPKIVTGIVQAIVGFVPKLADAGKQLIQGVWRGISDAGAWLRDKIAGFFGGVVSSIKNFFGIRSPSALFRDQIGKNMALGVGEGFVGEMEGVARNMRAAIPGSFDMPGFEFDERMAASARAMGSLGDAGAAVTIADLGLKLDGIAALLAQAFPSLIEAFNVRVVLEDGTLVGRLAPEIDRNLGLLRRQRAVLGM